MLSVRLPKELEERLERLIAQGDKNKTEVVKEALEQYLAKAEEQNNPYSLGKELFGKHSSKSGNLAKDYKKLVRDKIHGKNSY